MRDHILHQMRDKMCANEYIVANQAYEELVFMTAWRATL